MSSDGVDAPETCLDQLKRAERDEAERCDAEGKPPIRLLLKRLQGAVQAFGDRGAIIDRGGDDENSDQHEHQGARRLAEPEQDIGKAPPRLRQVEMAVAAPLEGTGTDPDA